jgi:hypothetical protein
LVSRREDQYYIKNKISFIGSECSTELVEVHDETEEFNSRDSLRSIGFIEERLHLIIRKQK